MPKVTPFLWFNHEAEEAMKFYVSIFKDSKIKNVTRNGGTRVPRAEWRPAIQIHGGHLPVRELRDPGRSGRALGEAFHRRRKVEVRLAQRQVWTVMANHPHGSGKDVA